MCIRININITTFIHIPIYTKFYSTLFTYKIWCCSIVSRQEETRFTRFKKTKNHLNLERNSSIVSFTKVI